MSNGACSSCSRCRIPLAMPESRGGDKQGEIIVCHAALYVRTASHISSAVKISLQLK